MSQLAGGHWNNIFRCVLFGGPMGVIALVGGAMHVARSPAMTGVNTPVEQPLPFSHAHHAGDLKMDCRYCHHSVERTAFAGMPTTEVCMGCHSKVWTGLAAVQTLHASQRTGMPIEWLRVHDLADFACFDHSIHVQKGIGCVSCHGRVDRMPQVWKAKDMTMKWCLDCHRNPEQYVQPRFSVCDMTWSPPADEQQLRDLARRLDISPVPADRKSLGEALVVKYGIRRQTSCSNCHH